MEHRWGERVELRLTVELSSGSSLPVAGSMVNVSSSGAFVRTIGRRPPRGPVEVTFAEPGSDRGRVVQLPGYVVRESSTGVGIEWSQFAPRVVRELLLRDRRAGATRARARALPSIRHSARGPDTTRQPRAQSGPEPITAGTNTLPVVASAAREWALGPVGQLSIRRLLVESGTAGTEPTAVATAARW
jgi:PilZ domain